MKVRISVSPRPLGLREEGTKLGRPGIDGATIDELNEARYKLKWSVRKIARETGLSIGVVSKYTAKNS